MIRFLLALAVTALTTQAYASFGVTNCSSPDGQIKYSFLFRWDLPETTDQWTINGQEYSAKSTYDANDEEIPAEVTAEELSERQTLTSESNPMVGSSIYTYKVKLTYQKAGQESKKTESWVICSSAGGI